MNPQIADLPAETLCDLLNALERAREAAPQLPESTAWAPKELTRAPAENELPPSDLVPCSSPPGSRLSIDELEAWSVDRARFELAMALLESGRVSV